MIINYFIYDFTLQNPENLLILQILSFLMPKLYASSCPALDKSINVFILKLKILVNNFKTNVSNITQNFFSGKIRSDEK